MSTVTLGNSYRFKDYNNNKYLNILVSGNPSNNSNVTIYSLDSTDMAQVWQCVQYSALGVSGALMKSVKDPTFALDNYRGSSNPNNADVYKIGTTAADLKDQLVEFILLTNGYYRIKLAYYDLYLTVTTESTYGGFNVRWQALTGNTNQLWAAELYSVAPSATPNATPSEIRNKEFFVKAYGTNLNLNVHGTNTVANARNVNVYEKENCDAQKWIAKQESAGPKLFTKINPSYALNINTADNNCTMYTAAGNDDDSVLEFEEAGDMLYRIRMFKYGKYLTLSGTTSGANVVWSDYATSASLWEFIPENVMFPPAPEAPDAPADIVENTYAIQANGTDFYLNVHGSDTVANDRNVNIYSKDDCQAQRWVIKNTDNGPKLFTKISEDVGYTLNIYTVDDNCTMYPHTVDNDTDSILEFVPDGNMLYRIKMFHHDKYLCIDGVAASGTNVKWSEGESTATVWKLVPETTAFPTPNPAPSTIVDKPFFIRNFNTKYNLNVHGTNTVANGRNVNVFAKEPEDAQRWRVLNTAKGPKIVTEINNSFALNIHVENNNNCTMYDIDASNTDTVLELIPYTDEATTSADKVYRIKMFHHNRYLDADGTGSGYNVRWSESPNGYTLWQFVEEDDMFPPVEDAPADIADKVFFIQNVNTGHFLNVHGNDTVANTRNVNVYSKEDVDAQKWVIENRDGGPKLITEIDDSFAVNIYTNDNNCTMYKEDGNDVDSALEFIPYTDEQTEASENIYRIKMHYHNRYLTVANRNIGSNAYWTAVDTEPYALWKLIPESEMSFETTTPTEADSPLVTSFIPAASGNYMVGRNGRQISEITIHHMAGNMTVQRLGAMWQDPSEVASSHYGVHGKQVGQYVKECDTAYTNGGSVIDPNAESSNFRAITIETANTGTTDSNWPVSNDTLDTLVDLVADIARRNNLGTLVPGQNLTWHSMYAYTECPGNYLRSKMQEIADRANEINSSAVFIRKLGTQYPLVITSTASDEGYGVAFSEAISESNQKWIIKDTAEGKEIINAFDTTQNLRLNSTNDAFVVSSNASLSKAYFVPDEDNADQFTIKAMINGLSRSSSFKWLTISDGSLIATAFEAIAERFDIIQNFDAPSLLIQPSYYTNRRFKIKKGDDYLTFLPSNNTFSFVVKNNDIAQIFEIENRVDGAVITSLADSSKYISLKAADNTFSTMLPLFAMRSVSPNISFIPYARDGSTNKYFIFSSRYNKFFGVDTSNVLYPNGKPVWSGFSLETRDNFIWELEEPDPVQITDWLVAYYNPIHTGGGRDVPIPDFAFRVPVLNKDGTATGEFDYIAEFKRPNSAGVADAITFKFTDNSYWFAQEPYKNGDIPKEVIEKYGFTDNDHIGPCKATVGDYAGFYRVAVGPAVIEKGYDDMGRPGTSMYGKGVLDAVIKYNDNDLFIHCIPADIKAHSWNNGVIQTYLKYFTPYEDKEDSYDLTERDCTAPYIVDLERYTNTYDRMVAIEFIGHNGYDEKGNRKSLPEPLLNTYFIQKIIFYDEK